MEQLSKIITALGEPATKPVTAGAVAVSTADGGDVSFPVISASLRI